MALKDALYLFVDQKIREMFTALPAYVTNFDETQGTIDAELAIRRKFEDGTDIPYPDLIEVPIIFPRTANSVVSLPVKVGDAVLLIFASRSIENWLRENEVRTPDDFRAYNINDAIAIPGLFAFEEGFPIEVDALNIQNNDSYVRIMDDGGITINSSNDVIVESATTLDVDSVGVITVNGDADINVTSGADVTINVTGTMTINGNLQVNGTIDATQDITGQQDVVASGTSLNSHVHGGVQTGGSNTTGPI